MLAGIKLTRITDPADAIIRRKHTVRLTPEERNALTHLTNSGRHAARTLMHARVLLQTDAGVAGPGWADAQIHTALGMSERTIARIRRVFVKRGPVTLTVAVH
jgi:hypothetical protein